MLRGTTSIAAPAPFGRDPSSCDLWPCSLQWSAPRSRLPERWCWRPRRRSVAASVICYLRQLLGCEVRPLLLTRFGPGPTPITPLTLAHPRFITTPPLPSCATPCRPPHPLDSPRRQSPHPSSSPPLTVVLRSGSRANRALVVVWAVSLLAAATAMRGHKHRHTPHGRSAACCSTALASSIQDGQLTWRAQPCGSPVTDVASRRLASHALPAALGLVVSAAMGSGLKLLDYGTRDGSWMAPRRQATPHGSAGGLHMQPLQAADAMAINPHVYTDGAVSVQV